MLQPHHLKIFANYTEWWEVSYDQHLKSYFWHGTLNMPPPQGVPCLFFQGNCNKTMYSMTVDKSGVFLMISISFGSTKGGVWGGGMLRVSCQKFDL